MGGGGGGRLKLLGWGFGGKLLSDSVNCSKLSRTSPSNGHLLLTYISFLRKSLRGERRNTKFVS